jgi:hypothetical protein
LLLISACTMRKISRVLIVLCALTRLPHLRFVRRWRFWSNIMLP